VFVCQQDNSKVVSLATNQVILAQIRIAIRIQEYLTEFLPLRDRQNVNFAELAVFNQSINQNFFSKVA